MIVEQKTLIIIDSQVYNRFISFFFLSFAEKKNVCNRIHASKKAPLNIFLEEEVSIHIYTIYSRTAQGRKYTVDDHAIRSNNPFVYFLRGNIMTYRNNFSSLFFVLPLACVSELTIHTRGLFIKN